MLLNETATDILLQVYRALSVDLAAMFVRKSLNMLRPENGCEHQSLMILFPPK